MTEMNHSSSRTRWLRIVGAAFAVVAMSFLILTVIVTAYAFVLAVQARGVPDQTAISHFATRISPGLIPWFEIFLTLLVAVRVARRTEGASIVTGLFVGILAGLLSLAVTLPFGGQLGLRSFLFFLMAVGLGSLGGFVGHRRRAKRETVNQGGAPL